MYMKIYKKPLSNKKANFKIK